MSELSQAIQLVGLLERGARLVPSRILFAFREEGIYSGCGVRGLWIKSSVQIGFEALQDLVWEWFPGLGKKSYLVPVGKCVVCGEKGKEGTASVAGQSICWEHLPEYWEELLAAQLGGKWVSGSCPECGLEGILYWEGIGCCTGCLVNVVRNLPDAKHWIFVGGSALPARAEGELRVFLEAWKKVRACPRCGSKELRLRRLLMDFPKAHAPIFPLWELTKEDMKPERIMLRERQLRIFIEGLLRVTLECPQCGYMDLEFPGLEP